MDQMKQACQLLALLQELGAEQTQVHIRSLERHQLILKKGVVSTLATEFSNSASVKLNQGNVWVEKTYAFGHNRELPDLAVRAIAELSTTPEDFDNAIFAPKEDLVFADIRSSFNPDAMKAYLEQFHQDVASIGASLTRCSLSYETRQEALAASTGTRYYYEADGYTLSCATAVEQDGVSLDPFRFRVGFRTLDDPFRFPKDSLLARNLSLLFTPKKIEPFQGTLLIAPDVLYYLLMDHLFSQLYEDSLLSGESAWKDKFDEAVCNSCFTVSMDPLHPSVTFGERITQDGCRALPYDIIRDGILSNAISSQRGARLLNLPASGNTGDNLIVPPGETELLRMVENTKRGVLLTRFSGGGGNPDGSFSGVSAQAFLIEDGIITSAVDECPIRGNWFNLLEGNQFDFSAEQEANGEHVLPWMRIQNFQFG